MTTSPAFEPLKLSGRRLFLTGGTGFVGKSLLDYFRLVAEHPGANFEVWVLSRDPQGFLECHPQYVNQPWLKFVAGNLQRLPTVQCEFTDVIHAAGDTHDMTNGVAWIEQIVGGTRQMLDFAVAHHCERFLLMSSGAVYGPQPDEIAKLSEDYPGAPSTLLPGSTYGQAKRLAEQLCSIYHHERGLNTVIARLFAIVSEHVPLSGPYAIGNFIRDALAGEPLRIKGDGRTVRSYLHGQDMAHWVLTLLLQGQAGQAYNVGSDAAISIKELAELVAASLAPQARMVMAQATTDLGQRSVYVPNTDRCKLLGLTVYTPLQAAIKHSGTTISALAR